MGNSHEENWAERRIAARPQEILANLDKLLCHWCHGIGNSHREGCPVLLAKETMENYRGQIRSDVEDPEPVKHPTPAEDMEKSEAVVYHLTESELKRYCDNARAYGWEAGLHYGREHETALRRVYETSAQNPFVDPNWDRELKYPAWLVTAKDNPL